MSDRNTDNLAWDAELSDREVFLIGKIIVQWGALEYEIFTQTLLTFDAPDGEEKPLPKAMNNLQVTDLLALWKERVVEKAGEERSAVLGLQLEEILRLKEFRDALVHGFWHWSETDLSQITTVRIRKKEVITTRFTAPDLEDFYARLARINFKIRFPGGVQEFARSRADQGSYMSRRALSMLTGSPVAEDWPSKSSPTTDEGNPKD